MRLVTDVNRLYSALLFKGEAHVFYPSGKYIDAIPISKLQGGVDTGDVYPLSLLVSGDTVEYYASDRLRGILTCSKAALATIISQFPFLFKRDIVNGVYSAVQLVYGFTSIEDLARAVDYITKS